MDKTFASAAEAVADIPDGASLAVGGFGLCGIPHHAHRGAARAGRDGSGDRLEQLRRRRLRASGVLLDAKRIRRTTGSYVGENKEFARQYLAGELEVELTPQGTLAERLRAGGCGIPAFYTPAGVGTLVADGGLPWRYDAGRRGRGRLAAEGDPRRSTAREYVLERGIVTDFALVRAARGDRHGNLVLRRVGAQLQPAVRDGRPDHDRRGRGAGRAGRARSRTGRTLPGSSCSASSRSAPAGKRIERRTTRGIRRAATEA